MSIWRSAVLLLTLLTTLLGGQTVYRCLMADAVTLNACHCSMPKDDVRPSFVQTSATACCIGYALPDSLSATATSDPLALPAPSLAVYLPRPQLTTKRPAPLREQPTNHALAPPLYYQFNRILI